MNIRSRKNELNGTITVPGSKSHTIRAVILAALADGISEIHNPLVCDDTLSAVKIVRQLGAKCKLAEKVWTIRGLGEKYIKNNFDNNSEMILNVGNSGSLLYFLPPILATFPGKFILIGDKSVYSRPIDHIVTALQDFGITVSRIKSSKNLSYMPEDKLSDSKESAEKNVFPLFWFKGPYSATRVLNTEGTLSQYISGFMMAAFRLDGGLQINLSNPKETPYLTMTQKWLWKVGVECTTSDDYKSINVKGPAEIKPFTETIPADWEAAAFPIVGTLISKGKLTIKDVDIEALENSSGDAQIVTVLQSVGADIRINKKEKSLFINGNCSLSTKELPGQLLVVDISKMPDAICALSVISCFITGKVILHDVEVCRKKETNRVAAMKKELSKFGIDIQECSTLCDLNIRGFYALECPPEPILYTMEKKQSLQIKTEYDEKQDDDLSSGDEIVVDSYGDHRVAMALACFGLGLKDPQSVIIKDAECCSVSFPGFYELMNKIGAGFEIIED